jgi:hypothetical protein
MTCSHPIVTSEKGVARAPPDSWRRSSGVPVQDVNVQAGPAARQGVQILSELRARILAVTVDVQAARAVEIPGDDDDRLPRTLGGGHEQLEIIVAVDDERDPARMGHAPAIAAFLKNALQRGCNHLECVPGGRCTTAGAQ